MPEWVAGWLDKLAYPHLVVWTAPSLDFARRTGLPATQQVSRLSPTMFAAEEIGWSSSVSSRTVPSGRATPVPSPD